jgi:hypothetical protein
VAHNGEGAEQSSSAGSTGLDESAVLQPGPPIAAELADRLEILDLLNLRARGADRLDSDLVQACHSPNGADHSSDINGPMHDFIASGDVEQDGGSECRSSLHILGNSLFERHGDDIFGETYHVTYATFIENGRVQDYRIGGRYLDIFRKLDGRWLIHHRDAIYDWSQKMPATAIYDELTAEGSLLGANGAADPLYSSQPEARGRLPPTIVVDGQEEAPADRALCQLHARREIAEVLYRRARAVDRADAALALACYHRAATERHGTFNGEAADFIDRLSFDVPRPGSPIRSAFHLVTNILVDFEDDHHAFVESYHIAWVQMTDGVLATIAGRYLDRFDHRDNRWAIAHRDAISDWSRVEPELEPLWGAYPDRRLLLGRRGPDDPLYRYVRRGA